MNNQSGVSLKDIVLLGKEALMAIARVRENLLSIDVAVELEEFCKLFDALNEAIDTVESAVEQLADIGSFSDTRGRVARAVLHHVKAQSVALRQAAETPAVRELPDRSQGKTRRETMVERAAAAVSQNPRVLKDARQFQAHLDEMGVEPAAGWDD